jgi:branched-chain amino acid transport system ATP-binding protein
VKPQQGVVRFLGKEITSLSAHRIVRFGMGLVPERRQLFAPLAVLDNLRLGAYQWTRNTRGAEFEEQMEWVSKIFPILRERRSQKAGTLSGGQQQMLAIARALMSKVKLFLLDETSLGLAPMVVLDIFKTLIDLHRKGITIVLVEKNAQFALKTSQYAYILENDRIVFSTGRPLIY